MGMNSMFQNFTNLNTTYTPNPFQPGYPPLQQDCAIKSVNINKPYEILNADKTLKGYFWYYGNSVDLVFDLDGEITLLPSDQYLTISDVLKTLQLKSIIYDFRMEPMIEFSNAIEAQNQLQIVYGDQNEGLDGTKIIMQIDNELSAQLVKGIYYIELVAMSPSGYNETLFSADSCTFEVR